MKPGKAWDEMWALSREVQTSETPDPKKNEELRQVMLRTPGALSLANDSMVKVVEDLVHEVSNGYSRAHLLAEADRWREDLGYEKAPPIEKLLISNVVAAKLRLLCAETQFTMHTVNRRCTSGFVMQMNSLLTSSHARFLRSIEALARVRRIARTTPLFQMNLAMAGGKQINVQTSAGKSGLATGEGG